MNTTTRTSPPPASRRILTGALLAGLLAGAASAHNWSRQTTNFASRNALEARLNYLDDNRKDIDEIAVTPLGEWVIIAAGKVYASAGFPATPLGKIQARVDNGHRIDAVAFMQNGAWLIVSEKYRWYTASIPTAVRDKIDARVAAGHRIDEVAFAPNDGHVVVSGDWVSGAKLPPRLANAIADRKASKRDIQGISFAPDSGWVLYADQWVVSDGLTGTLLGKIGIWQRLRHRIDHIALGLGGDYVLYSHGSYVPDITKGIEWIEYGMKGGTTNIYERMQAHRVPGVSLAIVEGNKIAYARGYGLRTAGTEKPVLVNTLFDAASLSKFVAALGICRLHDAGVLSLDDSLNKIANEGPAFNTLDMWRQISQGNPEFLGISSWALPNTITLRRLLSHTACMVPHAGTQILETAWPAGGIPTVHALLGYDGSTFGGGRAVWYDPTIGVIGLTHKYSGGGFFAAQAAAEVVTGISFEAMMEQRVFGPLGMKDSTFAQPLASALEARAAAQHDDFGNVLVREVYRMGASGGLYTTPRDYAKAMVVLLDEGRKIDGQQFLKAGTVTQMLTSYAAENPGLGVYVSRPVVTEAGGTFVHYGKHPHRSRSYMAGYPFKDKAIVVMVNAGGADAVALVDEIKAAHATWFGW